jgi:hypothetical protein
VEPRTDKATWGILASNAFTLGIALWQDWGVLLLLWPFWIQSVIIGFFARQRILRLEAFCTEGFTINDRAVDPTPETQRRVANFFALHYGFFHVMYFVFLFGFTLSAASDGAVPIFHESTGEVVEVAFGRVLPLDVLIFLALGFAFWRTHRTSHHEHVAADLARRPNVGSLMFLPYLRVVPMHLAVIFGAQMGGGAAIGLFMLLKTGADVGMHKAEHYILQSSASESSRSGAKAR